MTELHFHEVVLSLAGIAGILWFYGALNERHPWSRRKRLFLGVGLGFVFLTQVLTAFSNFSGASSAELFGFVGCVFGVLGAVRTLSEVVATFEA